MSNPAKEYGTRWESDCRDDIADALSRRIIRNAQHGAKDIGDLSGVPCFCVECKARRGNQWKPSDLAAWVEQANREAANLGEPFGVTLVKMERKPTKKGLAVMDIETFERVVPALMRGDT